MPRTVEIKPSHTPSQLRRLAASSKDANQSRRLLSIAAVLDGMSRAGSAKIGGMDRQTLRGEAESNRSSESIARRTGTASTRRAQAG